MRPTDRRANAAGLAALLALVALAAWSGRVPEAGAAWRIVCVSAWMLASGLSVWLALRATSMHAVLGVALALRVLAVPMFPTLSDDVYRYLWDGRLVAAGESPYAHTPDAEALDTFREEADNAVLFERMNSPAVYSVYPPVSQVAFGVAGWFDHWTSGWYALKALLLLAEAVGILALARVLRPSQVAMYAWHPLAVLEIAGQGHSEGLLVGAVGVAVWALSRRRHGIASLAVVAAGWTKLFPFVALPALWRRAGWPGRFASLTAAALLGAALLPADGWAHVAESLRLYGGSLDFYSAPFLAVKAALYPWLGEAGGRVASGALALVWLAAVGRATLRADGSVESDLRVLIVTFVGYAMVTPMLHPWNALGALAVVPLLRRPAAMLWLVGIAPLTYLRYVSVDSAYTAALILGWGGAAVIWWIQSRSSSRSASTVASSAESQAASRRRNHVS